jgi:hypothetical protein
MEHCFRWVSSARSWVTMGVWSVSAIMNLGEPHAENENDLFMDLPDLNTCRSCAADVYDRTKDEMFPR